MTKTNVSLHLSAMGLLLALHVPPIGVLCYALAVLLAALPEKPGDA